MKKLIIGISLITALSSFATSPALTLSEVVTDSTTPGTKQIDYTVQNTDPTHIYKLEVTVDFVSWFFDGEFQGDTNAVTGTTFSASDCLYLRVEDLGEGSLFEGMRRNSSEFVEAPEWHRNYVESDSVGFCPFTMVDDEWAINPAMWP